jgi:hypothetical protein
MPKTIKIEPRITKSKRERGKTSKIKREREKEDISNLSQ